MERTFKFLIKVNKFGDADMDSLKRSIYNSHSLFHMNTLNSSLLEGECKSIDIDEIMNFTLDNKCDFTLIYYNLSNKKIAKLELKYGNITSKKATDFTEEMESEIYKDVDKDYFFNLFNFIVDGSKELSKFPEIGSFVRLNLLCDDEDILEYSDDIGDNTFKVTDIDYESEILFVKDCPYGINLNHVTVLGV
ncbi:MAG: hypothetical protein IJ086_00880 [Clostridium sp.]|nr:hypothetical protein [Clostridium sp.]